MNEEIVVDERGRVLLPISIREKLNIDEGTVLRIEKRQRAIILTPSRKVRKSIKDFSGINPKRTGRPVWPTPKEIKSIWE